MLGDEITAQGVNAGAVVREAAKLMQGGGGGQAFFATAGRQEPRRVAGRHRQGRGADYGPGEVK